MHIVRPEAEEQVGRRRQPRLGSARRLRRRLGRLGRLGRRLCRVLGRSRCGAACAVAHATVGVAGVGAALASRPLRDGQPPVPHIVARAYAHEARALGQRIGAVLQRRRRHLEEERPLGTVRSEAHEDGLLGVLQVVDYLREQRGLRHAGQVPDAPRDAQHDWHLDDTARCRRVPRAALALPALEDTLGHGERVGAPPRHLQGALEASKLLLDPFVVQRGRRGECEHTSHVGEGVEHRRPRQLREREPLGRGRHREIRIVAGALAQVEDGASESRPLDDLPAAGAELGHPDQLLHERVQLEQLHAARRHVGLEDLHVALVHLAPVAPKQPIHSFPQAGLHACLDRRLTSDLGLVQCDGLAEHAGAAHARHIERTVVDALGDPLHVVQRLENTAEQQRHTRQRIGAAEQRQRARLDAADLEQQRLVHW